MPRFWTGVRLTDVSDEDLRGLLDQLRALILLIESILPDRSFERYQRMIENQRAWQRPTYSCDHTCR